MVLGGRKIATLGVIGVLALSGTACGGDTDDREEPGGTSTEDTSTQGTEETAAIQQASVTVNDDGIVLDGSLEANPAEVTIVNEGAGPSFLFFGRLNEGVRQQQLLQALEGNPDEAFGLVTAAGGAQVEPGDSTTLTVEFIEGDYVVVNPDAFDEVQPAYFTVTAATSQIPEPPADFGLEVGDFYFDISDGIPAGTITFAISNAGKQSHEIILEKKGDKDAGGFAIAPVPGGSLWAEFELTPGTYTAVCFFPDPKTGKSHADLGMRQRFTIE